MVEDVSRDLLRASTSKGAKAPLMAEWGPLRLHYMGRESTASFQSACTPRTASYGVSPDDVCTKVVPW